MDFEKPFRLEDGRGILKLDKNFFRGRCILDISNEFTPKYYISYDAESNPDFIFVEIKPKENNDIDENVLRDFMNSLIDHQCWLELNSEFGAIREKIVAEAFSPLKKL